MKNQQSYSEATYGEKTSFDQFLEWEQLPVMRNFVVGDIRKIEVAPWRRRGGLGCYIILGHPKDSPNAAAYVCEISAGQSLQPQKQMFEEMIYVLKGRGATSVCLRTAKSKHLNGRSALCFPYLSMPGISTLMDRGTNRRALSAIRMRRWFSICTIATISSLTITISS